MRQLRLGVCLVLFATVMVPALRAQMMEQVVPGEVRVFPIKLRYKGAAPGFTPFLVIVRPQDKVQFVVTSVDKDCDFEIKDLHVHQKVKKGVPATIDFNVPDEGKFAFACSSSMITKEMRREVKGTLVVKKSAKAADAAAANSGAE